MIGSHNSFSYLRPVKWWHRLLSPWNKCQTKDISEQYNDGIRFFDIGVSFDKNYDVQLSYGNVSYKHGEAILSAWLSFLDNKPERVAIRIVLDIRKKPKDAYIQTFHFDQLCHELEIKYPTLVFRQRIVAWNCSDYINDKSLKLEKCYGSVQKFPWNILPVRLYVIFHNKETKKEYNKSGWNNVALIDYV